MSNQDNDRQFPVQDNPVAEDQNTGDKNQKTHSPNPKQSDGPTKKDGDSTGF